MTLAFRRADQDDEQSIRDLQDEAVAWLAEQGSDQWQPAAMRARRQHRSDERGLAASLSRREVWVVDLDGSVVATFTLDHYADPEFWEDADSPELALYIHRMVVSRSAAGSDIGGQILDWAAAEAARQGLSWLRLDAWRTNEQLHAYYREHGLDLVRVVAKAHRGSGALFQRPALDHRR